MMSSNGNISVLQALCMGNSPVTGEFLSQRPATRSFDVFFELCLNKRLSKQSWCWCFETSSCPLWRHCNGDAFRGMYTTVLWWVSFHGPMGRSTPALCGTLSQSQRQPLFSRLAPCSSLSFWMGGMITYLEIQIVLWGPSWCFRVPWFL